MNQAEDNLSDLTSASEGPVTDWQSEQTCADFLQIEFTVSEREISDREITKNNNPSPCSTCGNHVCSQRQIEPESVESDELLDGTYIVFGAIFVFLVPLLAGIIGSVVANSSCFGKPDTWKSALGFIVGCIGAIVVARWGILFFKRKKGNEERQEEK